jgi:hypothetical protein
MRHASATSPSSSQRPWWPGIATSRNGGLLNETSQRPYLTDSLLHGPIYDIWSLQEIGILGSCSSGLTAWIPYRVDADAAV